MIVNRKTVDPGDAARRPCSSSRPRWARRSTSSTGARAIRVAARRASRRSRRPTTCSRCAPTPTSCTTTAAIVARRARARAPPLVELDPRYFKLVRDFDARFPAGAPSLVRVRVADACAATWRSARASSCAASVAIEHAGEAAPSTTGPCSRLTRTPLLEGPDRRASASHNAEPNAPVHARSGILRVRVLPYPLACVPSSQPRSSALVLAACGGDGAGTGGVTPTTSAAARAGREQAARRRRPAALRANAADADTIAGEGTGDLERAAREAQGPPGRRQPVGVVVRAVPRRVPAASPTPSSSTATKVAFVGIDFTDARDDANAVPRARARPASRASTTPRATSRARSAAGASRRRRSSSGRDGKASTRSSAATPTRRRSRRTSAATRRMSGSRASGVGILAALAAGFVSFLSPCVLPLVPGYLSAVTGRHARRTSSARRCARSSGRACCSSRASRRSSSCSASARRRSARRSTTTARRSSRSPADVIIVLGLFFLATPFIARLNREWRVDALMERAGRGGPIVAGAAFAIAWTPCVGPTLGAILSAAALSDIDRRTARSCSPGTRPAWRSRSC